MQIPVWYRQFLWSVVSSGAYTKELKTIIKRYDCLRMRCDAQNAESAQRTPTQDNKTIACQTNRINKFKECLQCRDDYDEDNNRRNKANEQKYENALNKLHTTAQKKSCGRKKRCQTIHRRAHSLSKKEFSVFMVKVKEIRETMVVFT